MHSHKYHLIAGDGFPSLNVDRLDDVGFDTLSIGQTYEVNASDRQDPYDVTLFYDDFASVGYVFSRSEDHWIVHMRFSVTGGAYEGVLSPGAVVDCLERGTDVHPECTVIERRYLVRDFEDVYTCFAYDVATHRDLGLENAVRRARAIHEDLMALTLGVQIALAKAYAKAREEAFNLGSVALLDLYRRVDSAGTAGAKGRALEDLVVRLIDGVDGFDAAPNLRSKTEEMDIWVTNTSAEMFWQKQGAVILLECKNWTSKCGKPEYIDLLDKVRNRRRKCDLGVLVSWNGFARTVDIHRLRSSTEPEVIVLLDKNHLRRAISDGIDSVLMDEWLAAVRS